MDSEIYNKIGEVLINSSPNDSMKIIAKFEIAEMNDVVTYTFSYIDKQGFSKNYRPVSEARDDLFSALFELKQYYLDNNLTNGKPIWVGGIMTVDIENSKISIEFKYEPFIDD